MKRIISMIVVLCLMVGNFAPAAQASQVDTETETIPVQNISEISQETNETVTETQEEMTEVTDVFSASKDFAYTLSGETTCTITGYTGNDVDLVIPEVLDDYTVTAIGVQAFEGNKTIQTVDMPDTVESIHRAAFYKCTALTKISFSSSLKTMESYPFMGCTALTEVELPGSLTVVGTEAFVSCTALRKVTIGEGCQEIQWEAFAGCTALEEINLPSTLTTLGYCVFSGCTSLVSVQLPDSIVSMGYGTFQNCTALETVNFPLNWTKTTCDNALHEGQIFVGCTKLTELDIPEGVKTIPYKAFVNCNNFITVHLPSTLKNIEFAAFSGCTGLTEITLPEGLVGIDGNAFYNCDGLTEVVIPGSVVKIGPETFVSCNALQKVTIGEGCQEIQWEAFAGCTALEEVNLPATLTTLGYCVFSGCTSLVSVQLPDSIASIGYGAFKDCSGLEQINYPLNWTETTQYNDGNSGRIFEGCTKLTHMTVPEGVEKIPLYAFFNAESLREVVLPSTLKTIERTAFYQCSALESIVIPENVTSIGYAAFGYCSSLKEIVIPKGATMDSEVFAKCTALTEVTIPELAYMGTAVFSSCTGLQRACLEEGVTTVPENTFYGCTALNDVQLPDSLMEIGKGAFRNCSALTDPILPNALKNIGSNAFNGCVGLKSLFVPNTVTSIGSGAFGGCTNLTLYCGKQSYGATYAIAQDIPLEFYDADWTTAGLDRDNSWFRINMDSVSAAGYLSMITGYAFREDTAPKNMELYFYIPQEVRLIENTLTVDGATCTNYTISGTTLTIPVTEKSGVIRFSLKPEAYARVTTYAGIKYNVNNTKYNEVIDTIYVEMPILSISAVGETASEQVVVSGVAKPGSTVVLTVEGEEQLSAVANKAGDYTATVTLKNLSNGKRYDIIARTAAADGTSLSSRAVVVYRKDAPTVTKFDISHNGWSATLEDASASRPVLVFNPTQNFRFEVDFNVTSAISKVFIVSTRNNISKFMVANWNASTGTYIAEGYFDDKDHAYVPGAISVQYVLDSGEMSFEKGYDFTTEEAKNAIPDSWQNAAVDILIDTEEQVQYEVQTKDGSSVRVTTTQQAIPQGLTRENAAELGYSRTVDKDGTEIYVRRYEKPDAYEYDIVSFGKGYAVKQVLDKFMGLGTPVTVYELSNTMNEGVSNDVTYQQMAKDVYKSNMTPAQKQAALQELDNARECNAMIHVTRAVYTVATPAIEAMALVALSASGIGGVLMGALFVAEMIAMDAMLESANDVTLWRMSNMMYQIQEFDYTFIPRWVVDPSGYVYDAETQERIAGATVTAYWIPYDESNETFWDSVPADDVYGTVWNAAEFSQKNPLNTGLDGRYAWDVPEGWWRVKCEATCYEAAWSQWLPVPPPQMDVNIALVSGDHKWKNADCTAPKTCTNCGITEGELSGHSWDAGTVTKEPTEKNQGEKKFTCTVCQETKTEVIPAVAHVHDHKDVVTNPTCTAKGYTTHTCDCGDTYKDTYVDEMGHSWNKATCTVPKTCKTCGTTEGKAKGHSWKNATCTAPKTCSVCKATEGKKLEHTYKDKYDATCEVCGYKRQVDEVKTIPVYRLYNPYTHEHLLTGGEAEKDLLISIGWSLDGVAWKAPVDGIPVYRLYNPYDDWHTYTISEAERDTMVAAGWTVDGVVSRGYDGPNGRPIYRLFNPYVQTNFHLFTAGEDERDLLVNAGWILEGVAWSAVK